MVFRPLELFLTIFEIYYLLIPKDIRKLFQPEPIACHLTGLVIQLIF